GLTLPRLKAVGFCRWRRGHGTGQSGPVENLASTVMIALQRQPAVLIGTGVPAVRERLGDRTSTPTAHLLGARRVHDDHDQPSLFRFGGEDRHELVPAGIRNT